MGELMPGSLREKILRLAREDSDLRPDLMKILARGDHRVSNIAPVVDPTQIPIPAAGGSPVIIVVPTAGNPTSVTTAPPGVPTAPVPVVAPVVPPLVTPPNQSPVGVPQEAPPAGISSLYATERTQNGFKLELQPELERLHKGGWTKQQAAQQLLLAVETAFSRKDALYNILIRYQSSFEGDSAFLGSLVQLIETWATTDSGV